MSLDENKRLVRRYFDDALHNADVCDEIFAPIVHFHTLVHTTNPDTTSSPDSEKSAYAWLNTVWDGWRFTVDQVVTEGDRVVVLWTARGTHGGEYQGLPPTYREVTYRGVNVFRIEQGRIAEVWDIWDHLGMWQQLGVLPPTKDFVAQAREASAKLH